MKQITYNTSEGKNTETQNEILNVLKNGGLIIAPSDTVYGLLVDATNKKAIEKLIQFKNRSQGKAISIFVSDYLMLQQNAIITKKQQLLLKEFLPGPFTVILNSLHKVSSLLESEKGTLGFRIPHYSFITNLVAKYKLPLTATSANQSGRSPHYQIDSFLKELPQKKKDLIDLIVDAGKLPRNKPSTVIDLTTTNIKIARKGDIVFTTTKSFISLSENQTKKIGEFLFQKYSNANTNKPIVFIIEGDLGVGKTILVKGIGAAVGIHNIISPTFVVYYEYLTKNNNITKLYHFDLYNIQEANEFKHLGIINILKPRSLLCFEWGEKTGEIMNELKSKSKIIYITMEYISEKKREIKISLIN